MSKVLRVSELAPVSELSIRIWQLNFKGVRAKNDFEAMAQVFRS